MFFKMLRMDLKRCFSGWKYISVIIVTGFLLFISEWESMSYMIGVPDFLPTIGGLDYLLSALSFDAFKVVIVVLFSAVYTSSFCRDISNRYLRMVLCRTDRCVYVRSKFLANVLWSITGAVAACFLCIFIHMAFGMGFVSENADGGKLAAEFYIDLIRAHPVLFTFMTGIQFGMVIAAFGSISMLFSAYQPNAFITIGLSGFLFIVVLSLPSLHGTIFDVLNLVAMQSTLPSFTEASRVQMYVWGMLYPSITIAVCCILFERRLKWRYEHGFI